MPNDEQPDQHRGSVGAGAESAAGLHGAEQDATNAVDGDRAQSGEQRAAGDKGSDRSGSEPLERDREHKPSYGGEGGRPRTSSDNREPVDPEAA